MSNPFATTAFTYKHIAAGQATTVVKNAPGVLIGIAYNSTVAATNVTTLYDNPTGTGATIAVVNAPPVGFVDYQCEFLNGLTIVTGTANGADMTVIYV